MTAQSHEDGRRRCGWLPPGDPLYRSYHDEEWGVPLRDAGALFELLNLEGFQAGLSWRTILHKRENFRRAFAGFDPTLLAGWGEAEQARLLADAGIVRNRLKVAATLDNARAFLDLEESHPGGFAAFVWEAVEGRPQINRFASLAEVPAETPAARGLSKRLKAVGFRFVGPTIVYSFMQAAGLVMDHTTQCFRYSELA
ncbi:DNA-3-methyladenine glycosylase I [Algihabitans albus]|uniref:DNA-3-methyladenine glycosylase I n=1 Tax=Algihabitans albus TaxID=2164067 RepID=UPI000E5D68E7|nr:DNA-3-methyladenine glycosylase I [Algihabitans albus]